MMDIYSVEYTDTFAGQANYCWIKRAEIALIPLAPDNVYTSAATVAKNRRAYNRELMTKAKAAMGLTGVRGSTTHYGDMIEFRPYKSCTVMFVQYLDNDNSVGGFQP